MKKHRKHISIAGFQEWLEKKMNTTITEEKDLIALGLKLEEEELMEIDEE